MAAALPNRSDSDFSGLVGIYDFGGGTFDFSIVEVNEKSLDVVASAGDSWLGGEDFDEAMANAAANAFWNEHQIELRHHVVQWQRLLIMCEMAKRELSVEQQTVVRLREAALTNEGPLDLAFPITRADLVELTRDVIERSFDTCGQALAENGLQPSDLNTVYLSSGTSYIPAVQDAVARFFGKPPKATVPPERAVLLGAAMYAEWQRG